MTATDDTILAIDLGRYKSVAGAVVFIQVAMAIKRSARSVFADDFPAGPCAERSPSRRDNGDHDQQLDQRVTAAGHGVVPRYSVRFWSRPANIPGPGPRRT